MAEQINGKWANVIQYGLAAVMATVAVGLVVYMLELNQQFTNVGYLFYILFLVLALRSWADKRGTLGMSYGKAFGHAMLIALVYSVMIAVWTVIFMKVIAPGFMEAQQELQYEKMREQGISEAQIELGKEMGKKFTTAPILFLIGLLVSMFVVTLINLVTAAFFIRKSTFSPIDPSHIPINNPYSPFQSNGPPSGHA
jgi:Protein of unknown function (DUF4199)